MTDEQVRTSIMHVRPHAPEHKVRIYNMGEVHVVCAECGMHDWGDWGDDESKYTVEAFKAKYGDRVLSVETGETDVWECPIHDEAGYEWNALTAVRADGSRGHMTGPDIDGGPVGECVGPMSGPVKGY